MSNICTCCDTIVPESVQVCEQCKENGKLGVLCPSCGEVLEMMDYQWWNTKEGISFTSVFHCSKCHSDWEKEVEYVAKNVKFCKKIWG